MHLRDYIANKKLDEFTYGYLTELCHDGRLVFGEFVLRFKPTASELRISCALVREISLMSKKPGYEILKKILDGDSLSKAKDVIFLLEELRYPLKSEIKKNLNTLSRNLAKQCGLMPLWPQNLEGDVLSLNLRFRSPEDVKKYIQKLNILSDSEELYQMFAILRGKQL